MEMQIDPKIIFEWMQVIISVGIPLAAGLWGVWMKKTSIDKKINESVPVIWGAVQQALRKNGGKLPGGKVPLAYGMELLSSVVKLSPQQRTMAELALQAYHESQGAPDAAKK